MPSRSAGPENVQTAYKNMTEQQQASIAREGDPAFQSESENDNSTSSPDENNEAENESESENENGDDNTGDKNKDNTQVPFDQHPAWKEREEKWNQRFNEQEQRHQADIQAIRSEFAGARKANKEDTEIPAWFGGNQEQWEAYRKDRDAELKSAEERAYERLNSAKSAEEKAVAEATAYMQSEIAFIQSDKALNPNGAKVDPNKLLKFVLDNDLVDSKGKWNYRAGWKMMNASSSGQNNGDRKKIAGATTSESKAETKPAPFKTSADFKKNRPW